MQEQSDFFNCKRLVKAYKKRIDEMEDKIAELIQESLKVDELKRQIKALLNHVTDLEGNIEKCQKRAREVGQELFECGQKGRQLEDHNARLQSHVEGLEKDLTGKEKALRQLMRKLADEIHDRKVAEDRAASLEVENRELAAHNGYLERKNAKLEIDAAAWKDSYEGANLENLRVAGKIQNTVDNIQVYVDSAEKQLEELEKRYPNMEFDPLPGQVPDLLNIGRYKEILRLGKSIIDRLS